MGVVIGIDAATVRVICPVATEESHIVHQRILAGHPHGSNSPAVHTARI